MGIIKGDTRSLDYSSYDGIMQSLFTVFFRVWDMIGL